VLISIVKLKFVNLC